ncbi:MAG: hypothetical protein RIC51_08000 [Erythrobacter sp.]|uniref:hypothetical protein n=1 Tax=Erythrobacter sp. TaxID=1042 RepID=UPI0032ED98C2
MKLALIPAAALALMLGGCNDQPDEALPPEGDIEGALPAGDATGEDAVGGEPELETIGEPESPTGEASPMESGANPPGMTVPPEGEGSKLQKADPDY